MSVIKLSPSKMTTGRVQRQLHGFALFFVPESHTIFANMRPESTSKTMSTVNYSFQPIKKAELYLDKAAKLPGLENYLNRPN